MSDAPDVERIERRRPSEGRDPLRYPSPRGDEGIPRVISSPVRTQEQLDLLIEALIRRAGLSASESTAEPPIFRRLEEMQKRLFVRLDDLRDVMGVILSRIPQAGPQVSSDARLLVAERELLALAKENAHLRTRLADQMVDTNTEPVDDAEIGGDTDDSYERELAAFRSLLPEMLARYQGEFVAIRGGRVVDHDKDEVLLAERVCEAYPDVYVLIEMVQPRSGAVVHMPSPLFVE